MQDLATDSKFQKSSVLSSTTENLNQDSLKFEMLKREDLLNKLITESQMLDRDRHILKKDMHIYDLEDKIKDLNSKA